MSDWEEFCIFADVKVCALFNLEVIFYPNAGGTSELIYSVSMKINSVMGKMSGKIGNIVVASTGGEVIGREYNPNVANPNTQPQQNTRAKFKLASQLSATMAPVIAIKKDGNVSARNQFTSVNFPKISYSEGAASINLNQVELTKSNRSFAGFNADRSGGTAIAVQLNADSAAALSRVVYICYKKNDDGSLQLLSSKTCNTPGANGLFADSLPYSADAVVMYAYGIKDLEAGITTKFGNMQAPSAEDVAQLLVSSSENMSSVQLTKTAGLTMAAGEDTGDSDDVEHFSVSVVTSGNGSATGGGRFNAGQTVTLRATPDEEATFVAWKLNNASGEVLSTANPYSFTAEANKTICAVFQGGPVPTYNIAVSANPVAGGTVSGGGTKQEGSSCTVMATPSSGYRFTGWYENGALVSSQASYTFTVANARTLEARFAEQSQSGFDNVTINGVAWSQNGQALANGNTLAGSYTGAHNRVALCTEVPQVGYAVELPGLSKAVTNGEFSFNVNSMNAGTYYLVGGYDDSDNEVFMVESVYEFTAVIGA